MSVAAGAVNEALALLRITKATELGGSAAKRRLTHYAVRMRRLLARLIRFVDVGANFDRRSLTLRRVCMLSSRFEALAVKDGAVGLEVAGKVEGTLAYFCLPSKL